MPEMPELEVLKENVTSKVLGKKNRKGKGLNQKSIVGIGNTYADEILWEAGLSPLVYLMFLKCISSIGDLFPFLRLKHHPITASNDLYAKFCFQLLGKLPGLRS